MFVRGAPLRGHIAYLGYVLRHKAYVYAAGRELGLGRWQLLVHDWHKLLPSEWFPYVAFFHGPKPAKAARRRDDTGYYKPTDTGSAAFDYAWLLHQKRAPHHWQFWVLPEDDGGVKVLPMPDRYRREMLADWKGAGRAQGKPDTAAWYAANRGRMQLHPETRAWVEARLGWEGTDGDG